MKVTEITCRSIANRTGGFLSGFTHTINPYHGCAYGRTLCGLPDYAPAIIGSWGERRPGIRTVGVVSPLWPVEDAAAFAARLDRACDRVLGEGRVGVSKRGFLDATMVFEGEGDDRRTQLL